MYMCSRRGMIAVGCLASHSYHTATLTVHLLTDSC